MAKPRTVDVKGLLYHFLQKDLLEQDVWVFEMLVRQSGKRATSSSVTSGVA